MEELNSLNEQLIQTQQELIDLYKIQVGLLEAENKDLKRALTKIVIDNAFESANTFLKGE